MRRRTTPDSPATLVYAVTPMAYTLMFARWAWAAWRDAKPHPQAGEHVRRFLHPWSE